MTRIQLPYKNGKVRVTSYFGEIRAKISPDPHKGLDLVGVDTKVIVSPVDGTVVQSRWVTDTSNRTSEWGNYVSIQTIDGDVYYFCHLAERKVQQWAHVRAGDIIGIEGSTGFSTGSHCHFEIRNANGVSVNPCDYLGIPNAVGIHEIPDSWEDKAVKAGAHEWSKKEIAWAIENGILKGDGTSYNLSSSLTREEMAVLLYRLNDLMSDDGM